MKTLVSGWFSFDPGAATAGDLAACELTCDWLDAAGCVYDIATAPPFVGGVNWRLVDPREYAEVIFVCGPFRKYQNELEFVRYFSGCRLIALNVSMPLPLDEWNPFDRLIERDSSSRVRPDMTFLSRQEKVPIIGVCLVEPDGDAKEAVANAAIQRLVESREAAVVLIDTRLDANSTGLRTPAEVESLLARMDVVVTTRLHGSVLALKHGVPVIAIEVDPKGAKLRKQMEHLAWPAVFVVDTLDGTSLEKALDYCLTEDARARARTCCAHAVTMLQGLRQELVGEVAPVTAASAPPAVGEGTQPGSRMPRIRNTNRSRLRLDTYPYTYAVPVDESTDGRRGRFQLRVANGNVAELVFPTDRPDATRIAITKANTPESWDVQLNEPHLRVESQARYAVTFLARADQPRSMSVGCAHARAPWTNLGLYSHVALTPEWQSFHEQFVASEDVDDARIHFDVGGSDISVEISAVNLLNLSAGTQVTSAVVQSLSNQTPKPISRSSTGSHGPKALILMYHRVARADVDPWSLCVSPERFEQQLGVIEKHAHPIRLCELQQALASGDIPDRAVVVTFDDGYADNLHNAAPALSRHGIPATIFVTTGYLDGQREFWWDDIERLILAPGSLPASLQLTVQGRPHHWELGEAAHYSEAQWRRDRDWNASEVPPTSRQSLYMSLWRLLQPLAHGERSELLDTLRGWAGAASAVRPTHRTLFVDELVALASGGLIEIGAHTVTHPALPELGVALQRDEIRRSQATLSGILGGSIASFSYPYGAYTSDTLPLIYDAGFTCACSTVERAVERGADRFQLPRMTAQNWDGDDFSARLEEWFT